MWLVVPVLDPQRWDISNITESVAEPEAPVHIVSLL